MTLARLNSLMREGKLGFWVAVGGIATFTLLLAPFMPGRVNTTTAALALLLLVLLIATRWGSGPAVALSLVAVLYFNYFFLPPVHTFTIADPDNWVALFAFLVTALVVGQLSARAKQRAEEAEAGRREIERLYRESQEVFERASQAEALRRSEQLKSALLDAVTHDLRTPLTAIKASATTLLEELRAASESDADGAFKLAPEDRREMLEVIDEEADRLNAFIGSMVELARLEAGAFVLPRQWGDVEEIVTAALQRAERVTQEYRLEVALPPELPLVRADERALAEVVYTLVDNACKYAPAGSRVRISGAVLAATEQIQLTVEDEGPGIPPELREKVFDRFFRATPEAKKLRRSGSGLGLAIARGIVEAHGGRIWMEPGAQGRGTRVHFTVPIGDDEDVAAEQTS
ncbi:MAG: DUF4118 domain-containing protein [Acidobacteria bacterium]|nr:DUF4118 domain-containing protein [Acidobacteriota bacterium]MBI3421783.1 DUF4118 domain-containing protein [Acidobacteriota bacterium]